MFFSSQLPVAAPKAEAAPVVKKEADPYADTLNSAITTTAGLGALAAFGLVSPGAGFSSMLTKFGCASLTF